LRIVRATDIIQEGKARATVRTRGCYRSPEAAIGTGKAIILVVDRDPHIRELEAHFLSQAGYSVVFEQNGPGALEQARKVVPEIVITEILVPMLDGLALCRRIKADSATRAPRQRLPARVSRVRHHVGWLASVSAPRQSGRGGFV
jgi:PleD family two-component response regulator